MGGIGKTELAWQYADRQEKAEKYPGGICWLRAREGVGTQIIDFARSYLSLEPPTEGELEARVSWCWGHWRAGEALIVFDDVPTFDDIRAFLPPRESRFKVLMTSRSRFGSPVQNYDIKVLSEAASLDLLRAIVEDDGIDRELETARQLCEWLGYLPLALELVGRYWARNRNWSLAKVFAKLKEKELNARAFVRSQEMTATHEGLVAAFDLSWEALEGLPQGVGRFAQRLGAYLSVLALAPIPWTWIEEGLSEWDEEELQEARSLLVGFSLLTEVEREWYELHPLIRLFLASKLEQVEGAEAWKRAVCQVTAGVCRQIDQTVTREQVQALTPVIPHLEIVAQQLSQDYSEDEDLVWAFVGVGWFYQGQGLYQQAEYWLEHCLRVMHDRFGEDHPDVAISLNNLAGLYESQGRYSEAEPLFQRALALRRSLLGEEHPNVAMSLNNLAELYRSQGRYSEAEPLFQQALALRRSLLGEEHPNVAMSLNNLAGLYRSQGRYSEAEPLFQQALALWRLLLGEEHPNVAMSLNNLAGLYKSQGRYSEAEPLFQQALALWRSLLGEEHPNVAMSLNNLAGLYKSQGRYSEAEPLFQQALALWRLLLGEEHPNIATSLNNLAGLYKSQGRYGEAEPFYIQAMQIDLQALGKDHPDFAIGLANVAELYTTLERYTEAEPLYLHALRVFYQRLGEAHPHTQGTFQGLANLVSQALQSGRSSELSDHPQTRSLLQQLQAEHDRGQNDEA